MANTIVMLNQIQAQRWKDIIYSQHMDFEVNPNYLKGYSTSEVRESFSHFRDYMIEVFTKIADGEIVYSTPLYSVFALISGIANSSMLNGNVLSVDKKVFKDKLKKAQKDYKVEAVNLLKDTGFLFDDDIFTNKRSICYIEFPDDNLVLKGLYLYSVTQDYEINQGMMYYTYLQHMYILLNPRLFVNTHENNIAFVMDDLLRFADDESEKEAIEIFHAKMLECGCNFTFKVDIFEKGIIEGDAGLCYYKNNKPIAIVGLKFNERKLRIGIKISEMRTDTRKYSDYVQNCSDEFKRDLNALPYRSCSESDCEQGYKESCKYCLEYTLNGICCRKCTCVNWGCIQNNAVFSANKDEIDTYLHFLNK